MKKWVYLEDPLAICECGEEQTMDHILKLANPGITLTSKGYCSYNKSDIVSHYNAAWDVDVKNIIKILSRAVCLTDVLISKIYLGFKGQEKYVARAQKPAENAEAAVVVAVALAESLNAKAEAATAGAASLAEEALTAATIANAT
ncbi:hypothetical protein QTP88_020281 [Uroleucon formosanum]